MQAQPGAQVKAEKTQAGSGHTGKYVHGEVRAAPEKYRPQDGHQYHRQPRNKPGLGGCGVHHPRRLGNVAQARKKPMTVPPVSSTRVMVGSCLLLSNSKPRAARENRHAK